MFGRRAGSRKQRTNANFQPLYYTPVAKPLLQILEYNQSPNDVKEQPRQLALKGQTDVYIARAEIDLKKAMQSLAFLTHGRLSSLPTLAALSLPGTTAALFWTIHALLQHQHQNPDLDNLIHCRNHDARLLFKQLVQLDLNDWYRNSVDMMSPSALPQELQFPAGTPTPGQMYRQHPCPPVQHDYYPVTGYFQWLFEEREQALLELLKELGATKVTIAAAPPNPELIDVPITAPKVFQYPPQSQAAVATINVQNHPWLEYEPTWQLIMNERLQDGMTSTQFELDIDVMGLLKTQIQTIVQLMPQLSLMLLPADYETMLNQQILQTRTVQVEFDH